MLLSIRLFVRTSSHPKSAKGGFCDCRKAKGRFSVRTYLIFENAYLLWKTFSFTLENLLNNRQQLLNFNGTFIKESVSMC